MRPARQPPARRGGVRMLAVDPLAPLAPLASERAASAGEASAVVDARLDDLARVLAAGDLLVVNDAATLPASIHGAADGEPVELRLVGRGERETWWAAVLGAGDWRTPTEHRPSPPAIAIGQRLPLNGGLEAEVVARSPLSPRLVEIAFDRDGAALWRALYRGGRPVQYSYLRDPLALWSVQTVYGSRPWAVEMPSAGRGLTWRLLLALRRRGADVAWLTHAAGLSSTGDPAIDRALPLPERFEIPRSTVRAIARTRARGGRVVAVGTTVVRALEGAARANRGRLVAGAGETDLVIGAGFTPKIVDGVLSGVHAPSESHYALLRAFADDALLRAGWERAVALGYRSHEFGDACLVLRGAASALGAAPQLPSRAAIPA